MTNTERIQANNAELREAIEIAEKLPEAGGGVAEPIIESLAITENGTYTAPDGVDGYSPVTVNVPIPDGYIKPIGTKEITENGTHDAKAYESVNVNVPIPEGYIQPSGELEVTENGTHDVTAYASVNVAIADPEESSVFDPTQETIIERSTATYQDLFVAKTMIAFINTGKYAGYVGCKFDAVVGKTYRISWDKISSSEQFVFYYQSDTILTKVDDHYGTRIQHTNNPFTFTATAPYVYIYVAHPSVPSTTLVFVTGLMVHEVTE